ncbi:uncharacterized protein LOC131073010 isoform X2 [Cryptomeria japonica]|uniref:uncharacterized protein LOC131073010 isoform X2 n=1 Tax=Cryptomeria japonica TaxID=3369 RepID=UPI0027DA0F2A|nr:uncharacterized protein LOC131073010 isoform X2 [Cryptomeria japonica]
MKIGTKARSFTKIIFYKYTMGSETKQFSRDLIGQSFSEESGRASQTVVSMDSASQQSGMTELEAELEAELERMQYNLFVESSSDTAISDGEMIDEDTTIDIVYGDLNVSGIPGKTDDNVEREVPFPNYAVSPIELERRLHELLESRQKEQIEELKVKLKSAEEKLLAKEMELSWWKKHAHQLSKTSVALNNMPGNKSNASITSDGDPMKNLYGSMSFQENGVQEISIVCDADSLSSSINHADNFIDMKCSRQGFVDVEKCDRKTFFNKDCKPVNNFESTGEIWHANWDLELSQSPTCSKTHQLQPAHYSNVFEEGKPSERKESPSLLTRRKVGFLNEIKTESSAWHPESSKGNNVSHHSRRLPSHPCFSTPIGSCKENRKTLKRNSKILQIMSHNEICEVPVANEVPLSPVLSKIQQWEALSRGESCVLPSFNLDDESIATNNDHAMLSVKKNGQRQNHHLETSNPNYFKEKALDHANKSSSSNPHDSLNCFKGKSLDHANKRSDSPHVNTNFFKGMSLDNVNERSHNVRLSLVCNKPETFMVV